MQSDEASPSNRAGGPLQQLLLHQRHRSVQDFPTEEALHQSLTGDKDDGGSLTDDWRLPVHDPDAKEQDVDTEVRRQWTLKSYLALDAEREEAFDKLCEEARMVYQVPVAAISLVDLGRQFAFASAGVSPPHARNTERQVAFCSHTILNKKQVMVVPDTWQDDRFRNNRLVTQAPFVRFYAGAPLVSPEGFYLGTFCVESFTPRPEGLTDPQMAQLSDFACRTVELLVQRRDALRRRQQDSDAQKGNANVESSSSSPPPPHDDAMEPSQRRQRHRHFQEGLLRHAGVATNLGALLYHAREYVTAMKLYQESVQTLMLLDQDERSDQNLHHHHHNNNNNNDAPQGPSLQRQERMLHVLTMMGDDSENDDNRRPFIELTKELVGTTDGDVAVTTGLGGSCGDGSTEANACHTRPAVSGIPGLYGHDSNLKWGMERQELAGLIFSEPFRITVDEAKDTSEHFIIPLNECSKATLFNMGLIHYHWGNSDTAMQFFDLASSLSKQLSPLAFDPVILGSFNNMAQIHLQYRRTADAVELLKDALARGNAALAALYAGNKDEWIVSRESDRCAARHCRRLRRKLARTVLNLGHVHFINSEYDAAIGTCHDALRLLNTKSQDAEVAAVYHNLSVIQYHNGSKEDSLANLDMFLQRAQPIIGPDHLQIAEAMIEKGVTLFEMGHLYSSMKPLNEALRIRRLRLGRSHVSVAESLCIIGKVLVSREEYDFGLNAYLEGLSIYREKAGPGPLSFDVAQNLLDVGRIYQVQEQFAKAINAYDEAKELTRHFFGENHHFVARLYTILGNLYFEIGDVEQSMKNFCTAVRILGTNNILFDHTIVQDPICRVHILQNPVAPSA